MEDPAEDTNVLLPFSEPIFDFEVPIARADRDAVTSWLLGQRAVDGGIRQSNRGGWRSASDLDRNGDAATRALIGRIVKLCGVFLHGSNHLVAGQTLNVRGCWATINEATDWNVPHTHFGLDWSAVFYLSVPPPNESDSDGQIIFVDPLGRRHGHPAVTTVSPREGHVLLFPADVVHMVAPHTSAHPRISMAMNLFVAGP